jgi:hypothetical protein
LYFHSKRHNIKKENNYLAKKASFLLLDLRTIYLYLLIRADEDLQYFRTLLKAENDGSLIGK